MDLILLPVVGRETSPDAAVRSLKVARGSMAVVVGSPPQGGSRTFPPAVAEAGGLYMTINDEFGGFEDNSGHVTVSVAMRLTRPQDK